MKFTNKKMTEEAMVRIEQIQSHIAAIDAAARFIRMHCGRHIDVDYGSIREQLITAELDEWRNLFLWAITLDDAVRDRIKAAAHQRFLADGMHVADWMNGGVSPGSWLSADEDEFREMAKSAFGAKAVAS